MGSVPRGRSRARALTTPEMHEQAGAEPAPAGFEETSPMSITVEHLYDDRFEVCIRGHRIVVDQPGDGADTGATPTELFVAGLAACVAFYARRAVRGEGAHIAVRCDHVMAEDPPPRVTEIAVHVELPFGLSRERIAAVGRAVQHCTVHTTLQNPPAVTITVGAADGQQPASDAA